MRSAGLRVVAVVLLAVAPAGCQWGRPKALTREALANAQYGSEWVAGGMVRLADGQFSAPAGPGSTLHTNVKLSEWWALGDLDGDGVDEAAAVLVTQTGEIATFFDLAVMRNRRGKARFLAAVSLGDRIRVEGLVIRSGTVEAQLVLHGPDNEPCCPTERVTYRWELLEDALVPVAE